MKNLLIFALATALVTLASKVGANQAVSVTISLSVYLAPVLPAAAVSADCGPAAAGSTSCQDRMTVYTWTPTDGDFLLTIAPI